MKIGTGKFIGVEEQIRVCDCCEKPLSAECVVLDYRWNDGYDHYGDIIETCSLDCLINELDNHNPESVFHPGAETISLSAKPEDIKGLLQDSFGIIIGNPRAHL